MKKQVRVVLGLFLAGFVLLFSRAAYGQFNASLSGNVLDSTQAAIPGATVTIVNNATQAKQVVTTSGSGFYHFGELPPGTYSVTVTAKGFQQNAMSNVAIAGETPRDMNITLSIGHESETVTVDGDSSPALQTADASIGGTLSEEQIQRLPSFGGDPYELLRTATGITGDGARSGSGTANYLPNAQGPGGSNSGVFQVENQVQISAAGQSIGANNYMIDGVSVNSLGQAGAAVVTPNEESISQLTVLSTSYSAEDGRNSGAQIKMLTKSGTNTVHGSLYFRYDEPGLNAFNYGVEGAPATRVTNKSRDYRASLGFPIIKDKLFFFSSYEGFSYKLNTFANQWIETPEYRAAVVASRPGTVTAAIVGSPGQVPRVNALLPATCSYYTAQSLPCQVIGDGIDVGSPGPITNNGTYAANFNYGAGLDNVPDLQYANILLPSHQHGNQYNARFDWYATAHDQFALTGFITKLDANGPSGTVGARPGDDVPTKPLNSTATFVYIHTFTPTLINEFRSNFTRYFDNQIKDAGNSVNFGIPYINVQNLPVPNVQFGVSQAPTTPGIFAENTYEIRDAVTKVWGAHTIKVGGEYRWEQDNNNLGGNSRPVYAFQGLFNFANNAPIYEGIEANPTTGGPADTARYLRSQLLGVFIQHDWKVTPNLTLNTGLRYEYFSPFHNKNQELNLPVLGPTGSELLTPSLTPHNNFFNPDHTGFEPKVGFAYSPAYLNNKTVLRGGFARQLNRLNFSILDNAVEDGPGVFNYGLCCAGNGATAGIQYNLGTSNSPFSYAPNPALKTNIVNGLPVDSSGNPIGIEVYGALPRTKVPYAYLYSLEIQQELPAKFVMTIGYQGSTGRHLPRLVNQNFLYSQPTGTQIFNAAYFLQTDSNSNYSGLNVHMSRQMQHGLQFDANYTWSKSLDQVTNGNGADSLANQTDPARNYDEWGPSDFDTRHRLTGSMIWTIPGIKTHGFFVKELTSGWQANAIYTVHTGFPFTPVVVGLNSTPYVTNAATISPVRPYQYFGGFKPSCSNGNYLSGADVANTVFTLAAPPGAVYKPGIGRNSFLGPCYTDTDLSAGREEKFSIHEHPMNIRFQANFYNAFNQLNLTPYTNGNAGGPAQIVEASPDATRAASQFGKPTSADAGRVIELYARIQF